MLLGFKKQFVEPILVESKGLTLRTPRKVRPKIGETLYMYTGLRTNNCEHITSKYTLKSIQDVRLTIRKCQSFGKNFNVHKSYKIHVYVDGKLLTKKQLEVLAVLDGFASLKDWAEYWLDGKAQIANPIIEMYHWTDKKF